VDNTPRLSIISVNLLMPKSLFTFSLNILCNSFDLPVNVILQLHPDQVTHPSVINKPISIPRSTRFDSGMRIFDIRYRRL
jgi:hypothetical protein